MRRLVVLSLLVPVVLVCASGAQARGTGTTLDLVAYSTPKPVMAKLIYRWTHSPAGRGVSFTQSYGPSGSQARAIAAGQPADIAFLSTGLDVDGLADAGLVSESWNRAPYGGIAANTVVAFAVRDGNPKHIHTWSDLTRPGVQVLTPNPFSSGASKWNVLAAYGAMRKLGMGDHEALQFVVQLFRHVVSQDSSAANAMQTFLAGKGDVLITYESEAYTALAAGAHIQLVIPQQTMLIQLPMVPLKKAPSQASRFIAYVHSLTAQGIFAKYGYRPVVPAVLKAPALKVWRRRYALGSRTVFKITNPLFGGWRKADRVWFDPSTGRMVGVERVVGGA
jgi:sulfate/thiosulfate transport system substrate-binding protein